MDEGNVEIKHMANIEKLTNAKDTVGNCRGKGRKIR